MKRDCPIVLNECPAADSPITNASSEAPDPILFAGIGWDLYDPYRPITLGDGEYIQTDCSNITWSAESQAMADLLAFINAQYCEPPTDPSIPGVPPLPAPFPINTNPFSRQPTPPSFGETPTRQFTNDRQYAQVSCPDGAIFEMAVEAGTVIGGPFPEAVGQAWVEYINAYLLAWILQQLYDARVCIEVPDLDQRTEPGKAPPPPPSGGTPSTFSSKPVWCCLGSSLVEGQNTYNISGGSESAVWTFVVSGGSLAPGTMLVQTGPRTAVVSGTPTVAGLYSYTILATSGSSSISANETLHVFGLVSNTLPEGESGAAYSETLVASGGTAPITFSGTAPTGLTLASDGTVSGVPSTGNYSFAVTITDANGATCSTNVSLSVVNACDTNWNTLLWGATNIFAQTGGTTITFLQDSLFSATFDDTIDCPNTTTDEGWALIQGTITCSGNAACTCKLHVDLSSLNRAGIIVQGNISVNVPFPGTGVLWTFSALPADGGYDNYFFLQDSGGVPFVVTVQIVLRINIFADGNPRNVRVSGSISNV